MDDYVDTEDDNGGVHTNSGIPNKAFHLAATAIGGKAWEGAGQIWYAALTSGIAADTDFAGFADATVTAAAGGLARGRRPGAGGLDGGRRHGGRGGRRHRRPRLRSDGSR